MLYNKDPKDIEEKSFGIITEELGELYSGVEFACLLQEAIVKRAIHTSADFEYYQNLKFTHDVLERLVSTFHEECTIYTDTSMAFAGINKTVLEQVGWGVRCLIADACVRTTAQQMSTTRSMAAVDVALTHKGKKIFVIGNAPTALYRIMENYPEHKGDIVAVIGVPVGFVGARESKDELYASHIPSIVALGRKGGSNVAAAIINAVLYDYQRRL